jgi:hypothetical protein
LNPNPWIRNNTNRLKSHLNSQVKKRKKERKERNKQEKEGFETDEKATFLSCPSRDLLPAAAAAAAAAAESSRSRSSRRPSWRRLGSGEARRPRCPRPLQSFTFPVSKRASWGSRSQSWEGRLRRRRRTPCRPPRPRPRPLPPLRLRRRRRLRRSIRRQRLQQVSTNVTSTCYINVINGRVLMQLERVVSDNSIGNGWTWGHAWGGNI